MADNSQFDLLPFDGKRDRPPRAGAGRPPGAKNKSRAIAWRIAEMETPAIMAKVCERAKRLKDDGDIRCAEIILNRTWPRPARAPVQIDISQFGPQTLLTAVAAGQLTASDAAALMNATAKHRFNGESQTSVVSDARNVLAEKLVRIVQARQSIANAVCEAGSEAAAPDAPTVDDLEAKFAELQNRFGGST